MSSNKHYGLQLPKKNAHGLAQKHAAFGDDSDSEHSDGESTDWTKKALKTSSKNNVKRQTKIEMQRALDDDSTVYQYDEIYDQLQKGKQDLKHKDKDKKPKYIQKLMVAAEKRKIENERRVERQVQKERDAEGEEFKDKETFVTAAYKKKLEEFAKLDAEQKRQDMLEEIGDVTKQQDIGGFYRHLYHSTVNGPPIDEPSKILVKEESDTSKKENTHSRSKSGSGSKESSPVKHMKEDSLKLENENGNSATKTELKKDSRHYRKRKDSVSSTEQNKDADTEGSSSSSSSSSDSESGEEKSSNSETEDPKRIRSKEYSTNAQPNPAEVITVSPSPNIPAVEPERSIWVKRTVGPVFDAALKRYLERKSARLSVVS